MSICIKSSLVNSLTLDLEKRHRREMFFLGKAWHFVEEYDPRISGFLADLFTYPGFA